MEERRCGPEIQERKERWMMEADKRWTEQMGGGGRRRCEDGEDTEGGVNGPSSSI